MQENEQRWQELKSEIICPYKTEFCRKNEGIKRDERFLGHNAVIFTAECIACGKQATGWGQR